MNFEAYEAQAGSVEMKDIVKSGNNQYLLSSLRDCSLQELHIKLSHELAHDEDEDCWRYEYVPEGARDLGWLGYFIGIGYSLKKLHIRPFHGCDEIDVAGPFYRGVARNRPIWAMSLSSVNLLGGMAFATWDQFFKNNINLRSICISNCTLGGEWCRLLALAIGSSASKSLEEFRFCSNIIADGGMSDIIGGLTVHPNLDHLDLSKNSLREQDCVTLAKFLQLAANRLMCLDLFSTEINDEGLEALLPALMKSSSLGHLDLSENRSITTRGWERLASLLGEAAPAN